MFSERTRWWLSTIFHIETLFFLTIILLVLYVWWSGNDSIFKKFLKIHNDSKFICRGIAPPPHEKKEKKQKFNKHEERCREIFESMFGKKFKSVRPDWLKNPVTGENLELDGYSPEIYTPLGRGLAFEYDGEQHSKYNPHFHRSGEAEFHYQVKKDTWKDLKCKQNGIMLIRIPYFVAYHDLERYISQALRKNNVTPDERRSSKNMYE